MKEIKCLICDKKLEFDCRDVADEDHYFIPGVHDAVVCESHGNFGSTIFDPLHDDEILQFYICDGCIKERAAKIRCFRVYRTTKLEIRQKRLFSNYLKE